MQEIKFVNHASVLISNNESTLLTDPWYEGNILNDGWSLIHVNKPDDIYKILEKTSHIWISHEHPDHFSVSFFNNYKDLIIKRGIKIFFQKTKDRRVYNFLKVKGFNIIEIEDDSSHHLNKDFTIRIKRFGFYDSALIIDINGQRIINLNDCIIENKNDLIKFAKKYGPAKLLLTQFSYAAWKGGKDKDSWRIDAAKEKIKNIYEQAKILSCNYVIPFASFSYFSNYENFYMNENGNRPSNVKKQLESISETNLKVIVMKPLESQDPLLLEQNEDSLTFWKNKYDDINTLPKLEYKRIPLDQLKNNFKKYQKNVFSKNSKIFMYLISLIPFLNIFQNLKIYLYDLDTTIEFSLFKGINIHKKDDYHVKMHSNSLNFIFVNEFGYDTLTANANFEADRIGFSKLTKSLSVGSLNTLGYTFSISLIFNPSIYLFFLYMLTKVSKKLENPYD